MNQETYKTLEKAFLLKTISADVGCPMSDLITTGKIASVAELKAAFIKHIDKQFEIWLGLNNGG